MRYIYVVSQQTHTDETVIERMIGIYSSRTKAEKSLNDLERQHLMSVNGGISRSFGTEYNPDEPDKTGIMAAQITLANNKIVYIEVHQNRVY